MCLPAHSDNCIDVCIPILTSLPLQLKSSACMLGAFLKDAETPLLLASYTQPACLLPRPFMQHSPRKVQRPMPSQELQSSLGLPTPSQLASSAGLIPPIPSATTWLGRPRTPCEYLNQPRPQAAARDAAWKPAGFRAPKHGIIRGGIPRTASILRFSSAPLLETLWVISQKGQHKASGSLLESAGLFLNQS